MIRMLASAVTFAWLSFVAIAPVWADSGPIVVAAISGPADRVSGGSALLQITFSRGWRPASFSVTLNGDDVTTLFRSIDVPDVVVGLVSGLVVGKNEVIVRDANVGRWN
jgi:hypothetical protein